jgi:hypothetical protein
MDIPGPTTQAGTGSLEPTSAWDPGLLDLGYTVQDGVEHKATRGLVLG